MFYKPNKNKHTNDNRNHNLFSCIRSIYRSTAFYSPLNKNTMIAIVKTRSQAIAEIKQIVYRAINKKRYNFTMMEETSAMCDCGQTQAICVKPV